jgi:ubiquinone/menaquinone biosynthesis C-methylase UbiE
MRVTDSYQYQTFDDAAGMVDSYAKLRAMHLPLLVGRSLLDVGCNEGYYCGVALRAGASRVVGLDSFPLAIERARKRFPAADFRLQSWDKLPEERFDVVMLASAMHYLESDERIVGLLSRIRNCLKDDGLFILEAGISRESGKELVRVDRPDGSVFYPTWTKLVNLVNQGGMVWRKVGDSEPGDKHPRVVMHCRKIQPVVMFVRGTSMSGKSYLANSLSNYGYWRVVNTDEILVRAFHDVVPDFQVDPRDWPASLTSAAEVLPPQAFSEIADSVVREIVARSELVAQNNLPRQDPVIVDGFDPDHPGSEAIFKHITSKLASLNYVIWDSRLLSTPHVDRWHSHEGYVDCGGFLLPLSAEVGSAILDEQRLEAGNLVMKLKLDLRRGVSIRGVSISVDAKGPVQCVEIPESAGHDGDLTVKMPIGRLMKDAAKKSDYQQLEELSRMNVTVAAWTSDNRAIYLQGR